MDNKEKYQKLLEIQDKIYLYARVLSRLNFDFECVCPKDGLNQASDDINELAMVLYRISHDKKFIKLVKELHGNNEGLNELEKKNVENLYKDYLKEKNVTEKMAKEMGDAQSNCYIKWLECKENKDYESFKPYLKKVINCTKKNYLKREDYKDSIYDTILNDFEPGWNIERMDAFFNTLKENLIPLIKEVETSKKIIRRDFLSNKVDIKKQEEFSKYLLEIEGHSFDRLVLMTTEHPFTSQVSSKDERVTTHYYENAFISNMFTTMHEGGHALFDLGEPEEFNKNHISGHMTMAMHECMSRFFENMVARSEAFIDLIYPKFKEVFKEEFKDVSKQELYEAINIAECSSNRCEADELTYSLHVMIRYELEKGFINEGVSVNGLNKKWNNLYKKYLNVTPKDDTDGILQDVHWTSTYGYFPSYAIGSAYAAQIYHRMNQDINIEEEIRNNNIKALVNWLKEHAWNIASIYDPDDWIKKVTGEEFNPNYYINYLKSKYKKIYNLD